MKQVVINCKLRGSGQRIFKLDKSFAVNVKIIPPVFDLIKPGASPEIRKKPSKCYFFDGMP